MISLLLSGFQVGCNERICLSAGFPFTKWAHEQISCDNWPVQEHPRACEHPYCRAWLSREKAKAEAKWEHLRAPATVTFGNSEAQAITKEEILLCLKKRKIEYLVKGRNLLVERPRVFGHVKVMPKAHQHKSTAHIHTSRSPHMTPVTCRFCARSRWAWSHNLEVARNSWLQTLGRTGGYETRNGFVHFELPFPPHAMIFCNVVMPISLGGSKVFIDLQ